MDIIVTETNKIKAPTVKLDIEEMEAAPSTTTTESAVEKEKSCLCHDGATSSLMGTCVI